MQLSEPKLIMEHLPELVEVQMIAQNHSALLKVKALETIHYKDMSLPLMAIEIGSENPRVPVLFLTAGVHGLERIGSRVVISYLKTLMSLMTWDESTQELLSRVRLCIIPIVNPVGMYLRRRANGNGVDLMRNSPVEADNVRKFNLTAGHRVSSHLPWYRGKLSAGLEPETSAVISYFESQTALTSAVIGLDVHSGFGLKDRLWFPYAKTTRPFPNIAEVYNLAQKFEQTYPHHIYSIEPQALNYTTHGDLWDYLYDRRIEQQKSIFIPLTLELGSWLWIKKNPRQLFSALGIFNPLMPHRTSRILRRHLHLMDFLLRAVSVPSVWSTAAFEHSDRKNLEAVAFSKWYLKGAA